MAARYADLYEQARGYLRLAPVNGRWPGLPVRKTRAGARVWPVSMYRVLVAAEPV
jgi:hypothetical protein